MKNEIGCDVAVIGGGPAGMMAAIQAARAGVFVRSRKQYPWEKLLSPAEAGAM